MHTTWSAELSLRETQAFRTQQWHIFLKKAQHQRKKKKKSRLRLIPAGSAASTLGVQNKTKREPAFFHGWLVTRAYS